MNWRLLDSSVHGIFQARILEQVATSYSRGSSRPKEGTHISCVSFISRRSLYHSATWETPKVMAHGLSCSEVCEIFLDLGSNLYPLH